MAIEEMRDRYHDLLVTCVAYNHLINSYRENLRGAPRPLPTLFQLHADNIPRVQRLLDAANDEKAALHRKIVELEGRM